MKKKIIVHVDSQASVVGPATRLFSLRIDARPTDIIITAGQYMTTYVRSPICASHIFGNLTNPERGRYKWLFRRPLDVHYVPDIVRHPRTRLFN